MQISTFVGISLILWRKNFKYSPWFYALLVVHNTLRQNLFFHHAYSNVRNRVSYIRRNKKSKRAYYGNLAFGGRGPPYIVHGHRAFDATLGYPGEGWQQLSFATWNPRSLTYERFQYCKSLNYDVLALTELWRNQDRYQTRTKQLIVGEAKLIKKGPKKGQKRYPDDKAAGVAILLSSRMESKVMSFGSEGERVCWVRLRGPVYNLFIIAVYLPHRARVCPSQDDTLADVQTVLSKIPDRDCICMMGDINEQLQGNIKGITGKWTGGPQSRNSEKIVDFLRLNKLAAMNTFFKRVFLRVS